jgi:PTS system ascorbate-specific IIA component
LSAGIVIVTHGQAGQSLIEAAEFILDSPLTRIRFVPISQSGIHMTGNGDLRAVISACDDGDGVLVLTDLAGASPANLVASLLQEFNAIMVTGINLAMLLRVWNYRDQSLENLAHTAVEGGKRSIKVVGS